MTEFNQQLRDIVKDMEDTMYRLNGAGLANVQIFYPDRPFKPLAFFVVSAALDGNSYVICNPEIIEEEGTQWGKEGCLSFLDRNGVPVQAQLQRPKSVYMKFQDIDGVERRVVFDDALARCVHHEFDHLQGKLFTDRMSSLWRGIVMRKVAKGLERASNSKAAREESARQEEEKSAVGDGSDIS